MPTDPDPRSRDDIKKSRFDHLRRAEDNATQALWVLLRDRGRALQGRLPVPYGRLSRQEIRVAIAGIRAMRQVIAEHKRDAEDRAMVEALPSGPGVPLTGLPEGLDGRYYPPPPDLDLTTEIDE